jgi:hypothetical protein
MIDFVTRSTAMHWGGRTRTSNFLINSRAGKGVQQTNFPGFIPETSPKRRRRSAISSAILGLVR